METTATARPKPSDPAPGAGASTQAGNLADLLAGLDNGIRITGLVLACEVPTLFQGTSSKGRPYAFETRELQIWTGNKAVTCKDQRDKGAHFPDIQTGTKQTFKIKSVRMNGNVPVFDIDTDPV